MSDTPADDGFIIAPIPGTGPQKSWLQRLSKGLQRSSDRLSTEVVAALTKKRLTPEDLESLEEMLIEADLGPAAAAKVADAFGRARVGKEADEREVKESLAEAIAAQIVHREGRFAPLSGPRPYVVLFIGVNGSGKTTTLGKIAADLNRRGAKVLVAAGDTFRAAAIEQLKVWADRAGVPIEARGPGADAAGLAFDAVSRARTEGFDVVLIDTAGRLQNKSGLMDELAKIRRVLKKLDPACPHETLLVLDATVGRNALSQVEEFDKIARITGLIMTKLDGTARGGVLVPVAAASAAPVKLIGVGEGIDDLQPFDARAYARSLVGLSTAPEREPA
ncbi:MAG: signal recognition particle-docking protein FtsY [Caulobacteraceae bacterium]|nr:signal recognition particle-docking protein FtsY [Caulobacter sp.]